MRLVVYLLQVLGGEVGIYLGSDDVAVAEQLLHRAQVGAGVEQVRRERVAQSVRRYALRADGGRLADVFFDDALKPTRGQALAEFIQKKRFAYEAGAPGGDAPRGQVIAQRFDGEFAQRSESLLTPLPRHPNDLGDEI